MQADVELLRAALAGYDLQIEALRTRAGEIETELMSMLAGKPAQAKRNSAGRKVRPIGVPKAAKFPPAKKKRKMSAEGRARIAAAQRARWAKVKKVAA